MRPVALPAELGGVAAIGRFIGRPAAGDVEQVGAVCGPRGGPERGDWPVGGERRTERGGRGGEEREALEGVGRDADAAALAGAAVKDGGDVGEGGLVVHAGVERTVGGRGDMQGEVGTVEGGEGRRGDWGGEEEKEYSARRRPRRSRENAGGRGESRNDCVEIESLGRGCSRSTHGRICGH